MALDNEICFCGHWWRLHASGACRTCGCTQSPPTEDEIAFGEDAWVYCNQHLNAHQTGWCTISPRDKIGLGVKTAQEALAKCREWGFKIHADQS